MNPTSITGNFDDFSYTWTSNAADYWAEILYSIIPTGEGSISEKGDYYDNNEDSKLGRLSKHIDRAARSTSFYQHSALQLADQCRILVNSLQWSIERLDRRKKHGKVLDASYKSSFTLMCEKSVEGDLARVLSLLRSFEDKPYTFFQDRQRFPAVFQNALNFLLFDRPFIRHEQGVVDQAQKRLQDGLRYDEKDLLHEASQSIGEGPLSGLRADAEKSRKSRSKQHKHKSDRAVTRPWGAFEK